VLLQACSNLLYQLGPRSQICSLPPCQYG
jgi:hypothetical protein